MGCKRREDEDWFQWVVLHLDNPMWHLGLQFAGVLTLIALDSVLYIRIDAAHLRRNWMKLTLLLCVVGWIVVAILQVLFAYCFHRRLRKEPEEHPATGGHWHKIYPVATMESVGWMLAGLVLTGAAINLDNNYISALIASPDQQMLLDQLDIWVPVAVGFQGGAVASALKVVDMLAEHIRAPELGQRK